MELTRNDIEIILVSLQYSLKNINEYSQYPSYQFKQERIKEVMDVITKVRYMKKESK